MPLTILMTLLGSIVMIGSWAFVGSRMKAGGKTISLQVNLLRSFFLFMGLFCLAIFVPHTLLSFAQSSFPLWMAWGYVIGHVFLYIGLIQVIRLTFSLVPRLANKQAAAVVAGWMAAIIITGLTIATMVYGTQPAYDYERQITILNVSPMVGALIGVFATLSVFPAATLMIRNGMRNPNSRLRSFLLGGGLFIIMTAGPLHDVSTTWQLYMTADIISIVGLLVTATGVVYRIEERISPVARRVAPRTT